MMTTTLDGAVYHTGQRLRRSWYLGQKWLSSRLTAPVVLPQELRRRMPSRSRLRRDLAALFEEDWRNISAGLYRAPESLGDGPLHSLRKAVRYFGDLARVERRRRSGAINEVAGAADAGRFPRYYLQNFHYQTDGYLSAHSAQLYDHQVEVLFGGAADAMRRQALVPLGAMLARRGQRGARLLDLACGTGRFLREVKINYPRLAITGLDLSPFYLASARRRLAPWSHVDFLEASVEDVPVSDASYDAVTCCYLFHELPPKARRRAAEEMGRLLKPGGVAILVDSIQLGDEPAYDALIDYFPRAFHEPYYRDYARADLAALFAEAGLPLAESRRAYLSKVMTFRKPG
jgi:ubiquinone/menaquinone biosynthesis C-methylase UbiE